MIRHNFKKHLGQHFLKSTRFVKSLVDPLEVSKNDIVLEIGPGDGIVTKELLERQAKVLCIEIDTDLIDKLNTKFKNYKEFNIISANVLEVNIDTIISKFFNSGNIFKVTGSLPYNVSKNIISLLLNHNLTDSLNKISIMSFIVQDEVAKSYSSSLPKMTLLSAKARIYSQIKKHESIPTTQFFPKPKVDGGIIFFKLKNELKGNEKDLEKLLNISFSSPKKTLANNLKNSNKYSKELIYKALIEAGLNKNIRPSEVGMDKWNTILQVLLNL